MRVYEISDEQAAQAVDAASDAGTRDAELRLAGAAGCMLRVARAKILHMLGRGMVEDAGPLPRTWRLTTAGAALMPVLALLLAASPARADCTTMDSGVDWVLCNDPSPYIQSLNRQYEENRRRTREAIKRGWGDPRWGDRVDVYRDGQRQSCMIDQWGRARCD